MDGIKQLTDTLKKRMAGLSFNQRLILGVVATASIISVAVFSAWLGEEDMSVLFTGLSPEDASAALEELAKQDVPSELTNGGTTILVPEPDVYRLRVDLANQGIPSTGTVGFEIFDGKQYGLTEFLQNVNFKRALEGELTKSVETLQGIQSARVHLVLPKPSIFAKLAADATASVVLRLGRNARLSEGQISGIQSLVAGSVENLDIENVTVIDQQGKVLSVPIRDDDVGRSESQLELRKEVEAYLSQKATSMLDRVLGPGRSIVRVDATLNFEKIDREREIYDPAATVVRSEARTENNDPQGEGTHEQSETNYEINRTIEHIVGSTGGVSGLSVAVFVDGHYEAVEDGGEPVYAPLTENEIGQLRRIVQTTVGLNTVRGDQIEVVNMPFRQQHDLTGGGTMVPDWLGLVGDYGGRVVLLIMLGVVVMMLRKNIGRLVGDTFHVGGPASISGDSTASSSPLDDMESFDGIPDLNNQVVQDIQDYASENPERVADVIQSWVHDLDPSGKARRTVGS